MKKTTTINIDENILATAKKEIPNISTFVENCMRTYLGLNTDVESIQSELDKIKNAKLNICILTNKEKDIEPVIEIDKQRINQIWVKVWSEYRKNDTYTPRDFDLACAITGLNAREMDELLNKVKYNVPQINWVKCDDFETAKRIVEKYE